MSTYENILVETRGNVGLITLNRANGLNTLSRGLFRDLGAALKIFEDDRSIRCIVLTGSAKAVAAGGDIKELLAQDYESAYLSDFVTVEWEVVSRCRKPIIAAVAGYALGGGCEVAMMCDFIIAADNAKFGQPELNLATIPGCGGTQRLARFIGKAKTMDLCLTGRHMDAQEAERSGLVSRIVPADSLIAEAVATAQKIADQSPQVTLIAKECVNTAFETSLAEGIRFERRMFYSTFAIDDRKEGMEAFLEKRKPSFAKQKTG